MKTYHLDQFGGFAGLVLRNQEDVLPEPTEIVIRVRAASINRRDLMIANKTYPLPAKLGIVPLSDGAGEVVAVGNRVTRFQLGDRGRLAADLVDQLGCTVDAWPRNTPRSMNSGPSAYLTISLGRREQA